MSRFDVLGPTHKGLRNGLMKLQFKTAQMNFSNLDQIKSLISDLDWMIKILEAHAIGEDKFLFPLLQKVNPVVFQILEEEHSGLEIVQNNLLKELQDIQKSEDVLEREEHGTLFTRNLNDFIAHYYIHLQTEELKAIPELWNSYKDPELMQAVGKFATVTPPDVSTKFTEYIMPALNPKERISFMINLKNNVPDQLYKTFLGTAEKVLSKEDFSNLQKANQ